MLTITEALAEIKTIAKRLEAKRNFVRQYLTRNIGQVDPLEKQGGSVGAIAEARQAIGDLESRVVAIRMAIAEANNRTQAEVEGIMKTIAEWLVWKREVAPGQRNFLVQMHQTVQQNRGKGQARLLSQKVGEGSCEVETDTVVNVDEKMILEQAEKLETILGVLDGKLSLLNATTTIDV